MYIKATSCSVALTCTALLTAAVLYHMRIEHRARLQLTAPEPSKHIDYNSSFICCSAVRRTRANHGHSYAQLLQCVAGMPAHAVSYCVAVYYKGSTRYCPSPSFFTPSNKYQVHHVVPFNPSRHVISSFPLAHRFRGRSEYLYTYMSWRRAN